MSRNPRLAEAVWLDGAFKGLHTTVVIYSDFEGVFPPSGSVIRAFGTDSRYQVLRYM